MLTNIAQFVCCSALASYTCTTSTYSPTLNDLCANPTRDNDPYHLMLCAQHSSNPIFKLILPFVGHIAVRACDPHTAHLSSDNHQTTDVLLNSEAIKLKFGSYHIELIPYHQPDVRLSNLYSLENGKKITRTLALVTYPTKLPDVLAAEHQHILNGASIGKTFKQHGWCIDKNTVLLGTIQPNPELGHIYTMMDIQPTTLTIHAYELTVRQNDSTNSYATIIEMHHPDHLSI